MAEPLSRVLYWSPRILGLVFVAFLAMFALDVFTEYQSPAQVLGAFALNLLPAVLMLGVLIVAWKYELAGAALLALAGIGYAVRASTHPSWILVIAGPLFLLAALFVLSRFGRSGPAHAASAR